jgi:hypothetical protein
VSINTTASTEIIREGRDLGLSQASLISSRAQRGWDLHLSLKSQIQQTGKDTFVVPSARYAEVGYRVSYGGAVESCSCPDSECHPEVSCKHLSAVALFFAARRSRCSCKHSYRREVGNAY